MSMDPVGLCGGNVQGRGAGSNKDRTRQKGGVKEAGQV